jgi:hypothetical protein
MRQDEIFKEHEITYYINEEKRTIAAVLKVDPYDVALEISNIADKSLKPNLITIVPTNTNFLINDTYVGKAVCHKEDEWDVVKGKQIARLKALRAFMIDRKKVTQAVEKSFEEALERIKKANNYSEYGLRHINEELNKE